MTSDTLKITILDDGTIKVETDQISQANHRSADELVKLLGTLMGGDVTIDQHRPGHVHQAQGQHQQHSH
jgi:hypothetical protein